MTEPRDIWLGDLLRCLDRLGPVAELHKAKVAQLLGFTWTSAASEPSTERAAAPTQVDSVAAEGADADAGGSILSKTTLALVDVKRADRVRLRPVGRVTRDIVRPWEESEALERFDARCHDAPVEQEPLWEPGWTPALLGATLATEGNGHTMDEERAVETIARGRSLSELPMLPRNTLSRGAQVLVDMGEEMTPYARDRSQLVREVSRIAGRSRLTTLRFQGTPLRGAGSSGRPTWQRYKPPDPGTPVLAITVLGIGGHTSRAPRASHAEWLELASLLERRGSPLLALVPYPQARWPKELTRALTILRWDRPTTVAEVRERISRGVGRR